MHLPLNLSMANQSLLAMLPVGVVAGWVAAKFVQGHGLGIAADVIAAVVGVYVGNWVLRRLGFHFGSGPADRERCYWRDRLPFLGALYSIGIALR